MSTKPPTRDYPRETEFGVFDYPCEDYDPGQIIDGKIINPDQKCAYCGFEKTWHKEFACGRSQATQRELAELDIETKKLQELGRAVRSGRFITSRGFDRQGLEKMSREALRLVEGDR